MKKHIETLIALAAVFTLIAFIESTLNIFEWGKAWKTILAIFTLLGGLNIYSDISFKKVLGRSKKTTKLHKSISIKTSLTEQQSRYIQTMLDLDNDAHIAFVYLASSRGYDYTKLVSDVFNFKMEIEENGVSITKEDLDKAAEDK